MTNFDELLIFWFGSVHESVVTSFIICDSFRDLDRHGVGLAQSGAGTAARADWRPPRLHVRWPAGRQAVRTGAVGRRAGGWSGDGGDAFDRHFSPAGRD